MAKLSELDPAEAGAELYRQYMSAHDAWLADKENVRHPSFDTKAWRQTARDAGTMRDAATDANAGLGRVTIQKRGTPAEEGASDDVQPEKDAGGNSGNGGAMAAQDSGRYSLDSAGVPRFETTGGQVIVGDAAIEANARQSSPARVQRMSANLAGYSRLK